MRRSSIRILLLSAALLCSALAGDVTVTSTVDQRRIASGESLTYMIAVAGTQRGVQPTLTPVDGLTFEGPQTQSSMTIVNGQVSAAVNLLYRVTPARMGQFTIPANNVTVAGKTYTTSPITIDVEKGAAGSDWHDSLYTKVRIGVSRIYLGQAVPVIVDVYARQSVPLKGFNGFQCTADGLGFKFLQNLQSGTEVINGESFRVFRIEGIIAPTHTGPLTFGPCAIKCQVVTARRGHRSPSGDEFFDSFFGNAADVREVAVATDPVTIEVLPLPEQDRPADFAGAMGQWKLEVIAKPTTVAVGDPITVTVKISGDGNIDTVPAPKLGGLDDFKAYDPTTKTTKNELGTQGTREFQQVLVAKNTAVTELPEVRLAYFDPVAEKYQIARHAPIKITVTAGSGGATAVVSGAVKSRPAEKLGQDIVYLKGDLGPTTATTPFYATPTFWTLNIAPVLWLLGSVAWKQRSDRLRDDVAYARRSRAFRNARKLLATAGDYDAIQRALQNYLGDRLNIPASGITAAIVDEQLMPRGVNGELAAQLRECFATCDNARFAGARSDGSADVRAAVASIERVIDELEGRTF